MATSLTDEEEKDLLFLKHNESENFVLTWSVPQSSDVPLSKKKKKEKEKEEKKKKRDRANQLMFRLKQIRKPDQKRTESELLLANREHARASAARSEARLRVLEEENVSLKDRVVYLKREISAARAAIQTQK